MKNLDSPKEEVVKCFHCGNETLMSQKGEYSWGSRDIEYDDFSFLYEYKLFACPVCHKVTLREIYGDETMAQPSYRREMEWYSNKSILILLTVLIVAPSLQRSKRHIRLL